MQDSQAEGQEQDYHYDIRTIERMFKRLPQEQQQETWLKFSNVMEGYAEKHGQQFKIELMSEHTDDAQKLLDNWGKMQGLSSGYRKIDELTKGLADGEMIVIGGKTSHCKTLVAINIANKVAIQGTPVLFFTMEMTKAEVTSRFMKINEGSVDGYSNVSAMIAFQSVDELNWKSIDGLVESFVKDMDKGLIVIDHLHYFTRSLENVAEDLGRITKEIKKNAIRHNIPIILISHVRKTNSSRDVDIDDLRGSSYVSQDADIVLMINRNADNQKEFRIRIDKNRNRGFDFKQPEVTMYLDGIRLSNDEFYA